jgi:hypothetical protein
MSWCAINWRRRERSRYAWVGVQATSSLLAVPVPVKLLMTAPDMLDSDAVSRCANRPRDCCRGVGTGQVGVGPYPRTTLTPTCSRNPHPNPSDTLTPTATTPRGHPVPGPVRRARGSLVFSEAVKAVWQCGLETRWGVNLPNLPNFRGIRNGGKFTGEDSRLLMGTSAGESDSSRVSHYALACFRSAA